MIQKGKTLSDRETELINTVIDKIKDIAHLERRVQSFVYEEFIDDYIEYYATNYKAWNTKDAIHRRLGTFEERSFDTYFDAKVISGGIDENEMLQKFTSNLKDEVIQLINELGESLEDLRTLTPEIIKRFEIQYDLFIEEVGNQMADFLREKNHNSVFWQELIDRRGKGPGYNQEVCTIFRQKLEKLDSGVSANRIFQEFSEKEWKKTIGEILKFFKSN